MLSLKSGNSAMTSNLCALRLRETMKCESGEGFEVRRHPHSRVTFVRRVRQRNAPPIISRPDIFVGVLNATVLRVGVPRIHHVRSDEAAKFTCFLRLGQCQ